MGIILIITTITYGYFLKKNGNTWQKLILNSCLIFIISRLAGLFFQVAFAKLFYETSDLMVLVGATIIPAFLYVYIPNLAFKQRWWNIKTKKQPIHKQKHFKRINK